MRIVDFCLCGGSQYFYDFSEIEVTQDSNEGILVESDGGSDGNGDGFWVDFVLVSFVVLWI